MPVGALGVEPQSLHATPPHPARRTASKERSYFRASNSPIWHQSKSTQSLTTHPKSIAHHP